MPSAPQFLLAGRGVLTASATAALADASATAIDATGITAATALPTANPNCLIVANAGMVTNAQNVIVSGTCANLSLTDGYPFRAPEDFTATAATYTTTINAEAEAGTLCLPFSATIPTGVDAYTLAYTSGDAATATPVETTIPANTPVLLNGSGEVTFTGSSAAISASATNVNGALTGVFASTTVPTDSYVLQKSGGDLGFYKVATDDIIAAPFRAYLTATGAARSLRIVYADEATGISAVAANGPAERSEVYSLSGQRVAAPTKGLYIVNGKKVVIK